MKRMILSMAWYGADKEKPPCWLDRHSMSPLAIASLVVMVCLLPTWVGVQAANKKQGSPPPKIKEALTCLLKADFVQQYDLNYLGLKIGDLAWMQYEIGSIPETGETPRVLNIVLYSPDGKKGILLFAEPNESGGFNAIMNAYHLYRHGSKWSADYGNGGYIMYETIGKFVTELSRGARYRIRLAQGGEECKMEGN